MSSKASKPETARPNAATGILTNGYKPRVQGGFKPSGTISTSPPTGGSAIKPVPPRPASSGK